MPEKLHAQPRPEVGALDQTRDVGHHIAVLVRRFSYGDDAQVWLQRGEGVVGNLWFRG
jgi:hypothetical protein